MNQHKMRDAQIDAALAAHRLPVDEPSQLSDAFRAGWRAARAQPVDEVQRKALKEADALTVRIEVFYDGADMFGWARVRERVRAALAAKDRA